MSTSRWIQVCLAVIASVGLGATYASSVESGTAGNASMATVVSIAQEDNRAMEHLDHLVNDIGSRPVNTVNFLEACMWARDAFESFGLENVHLERCGEIKGDFTDRNARARFRRLHRSLFGEPPDGDVIPICNVVADLPGSVLPNEYVICGAHLDSAPQGPGATDNGTGVAAVMEAARILAASGERPRRTIRFVLFGGEEAGLVGSKGYVEDHPGILPRVSAMYNMDRGQGFISGVMATSPLTADMRKIFAAAATLDAGMPFEVEEVEYLPSSDPNCCAALVREENDGSGKRRIVTQPGCGGKDPGGSQPGCGAQNGGAPTMIVKEVTATGDTLVKQVFIPGAPGAGEDMDLDEVLEHLDAEALTEPSQVPASGDGPRRKVVAVGSSDHATFLAAGIPSFWWKQVADASAPYPAHTSRDTYDIVNARYLEHSAAVIAIGALGTANLDHLLSREKLTAPEESAEEGGKALEGKGCSPSCCGEAKKRKYKI